MEMELLLIVKALNWADVGSDNGNLGSGVDPLDQKRLTVTVGGGVNDVLVRYLR